MSTSSNQGRGQQSKKGRPAKDDATVNSDPLFKGYVDPNPPTQDLTSDDDMNAFVRPKPRRHHTNSSSSFRTAEMDSSDEGVLKCPKEHYIFVGNVKRHMDQAYIKNTFSK